MARALASDDYTSNTLVVPWLFPHGAGDHCQLDCPGLRAGMGHLGSHDGVGLVVDRRRSRGDHMLLSRVLDVSPMSLNITCMS